MRILVIFVAVVLAIFGWVDLSAQTLSTGGGLRTGPSIGVKYTPIPGSQILQSAYAVPPGSPTDSLAKEIVKLEKVIGPSSTQKKIAKEKEAQVRQIISGMLDLDRLAQRAMIAYWEELGKTKSGLLNREKYRKLFKQLVEENYLEKARTYVSGKYQIPFISETKAPDRVVVTGEIKKTDVNLRVEFHLMPVVSKEKIPTTKYKVVDIKLDETSLESTYRSSFNRIIRKEGGLTAGLPELLRVMEKRLTELKKGEATRL